MFAHDRGDAADQLEGGSGLDNAMLKGTLRVARKSGKRGIVFVENPDHGMGHDRDSMPRGAR